MVHSRKWLARRLGVENKTSGEAVWSWVAPRISAGDMSLAEFGREVGDVAEIWANATIFPVAFLVMMALLVF